MTVLQSLRTWAEQHRIDYYSEITRDNNWVIVKFKEKSTYTLFAITYKDDYEWHVCM